MREKVVLAYSGGLDTSIIIPWLKENYDCDVIAFVADVGQGDDIEAVVEKAYATGASKVIVEDLRQEFLTDYVFPAIQAGQNPAEMRQDSGIFGRQIVCPPQNLERLTILLQAHVILAQSVQRAEIIGV